MAAAAAAAAAAVSNGDSDGDDGGDYVCADLGRRVPQHRPLAHVSQTGQLVRRSPDRSQKKNAKSKLMFLALLGEVFRVFHQMADLGWVELKIWNVPTSCPGVQPSTA